MITDSFLDNCPKRQTAFRCSEDVPCFGAMYITDSEVVAEGIVYTTRKWSDGDVEDPNRIIFNSGQTYISGEIGTCSQIYPLQARLNGTWDITSKLHVKPDSWDLHVDAGEDGVPLFMGLAIDASQAYYEDDDHCSIWVNVRKRNKTRIRGTIFTGNEFSQATAEDPHTIQDVEGIDEVWEGESEMEVYNPEKIKLWKETAADEEEGIEAVPACTVRCEWNATHNRYEVYAATSDHVVHGIQRLTETCVFEKLDGAEGWHNWDAGAAYSFVTGFHTEGCMLQYQTDCSENQDMLDLSQFVRDVWWSGNCLKKYRCGGSPGGEVIICGEGCEDPPPCSPGEYTTYEAVIVDGVLGWQLLATSCDTCVDPGPPSLPPTFEGETVDVPCEAP